MQLISYRKRVTKEKNRIFVEYVLASAEGGKGITGGQGGEAMREARLEPGKFRVIKDN